jgi:outer membrane receptor protein involved in Fe transport
MLTVGHSHRSPRRGWTSLLLIVCLSAPVAAQQSGGSLHGTVSAVTGGTAIQGARVAIVNPAAVALTDASGNYTLRDVAAGHYAVIVTAIGYKPTTRSVDVTKGQLTTLDVQLENGSLLLPGVVTTATRLPTDANRVATTINTLEPEQIRTSPARESQDLLREIPSVELPRTSSVVSGTAQIVSIRGVDEGRTVVLFDGIPVSDAWGEWIDWGRVPSRMLDRVEVVEGGTSSLYGNGAMGGVISFFSKPMSPGGISMQVDGGTRESRHAYIGAGIPLFGAFSGMVTGDYGEGGGYRLIDSVGPGCPSPATATSRCLVGAVDKPSQSIRRNIYARLNYNPSSTLSAFITGHKYGDDINTGTALSLQSRDQGGVDLGANVGAYTSGLFSIRAFTGRQDEAQRASAVRAAATAANSALQPQCAVGVLRTCEDSSLNAAIPSHDWGASAQWARTGLLHLESFSIGTDYRHMQGAFDETDYNTTCPGANCGKFLRKIWSGGDQSLSGAFVQAIAAPFAPMRVELSARVDRWTNNDAKSVDSASTSTTSNVVSYADRNKNAFSPRLGVRYQLLSNLGLRAAVYSAFRAPNLAELYRKQINANGSQITLPNPDLKPESALGREVGFEYEPTSWLQAKGTYYVADYKDFNSPQTLTTPTTCGTGFAGTCRQRLNVDRSRSEGIEASLGIRPITPVFVSVAVNYDDARRQSNLAASDTVPKPHINRVPSPKQVVRATYTNKMFGTWTGLWRHEGHTTTLQGVVLDPYTVVDANVQRELMSGIGGFLSMENIGDHKYQVNLSGTGTSTLVSYGTPRTLRVGVTIDR